MSDDAVICIAGDSSPEVIISDLTIEEKADEFYAVNVENITNSDNARIGVEIDQNLEQIENPSGLDTSDKMDELTSLEREIAILHHVEPTAPLVAKKVTDSKLDSVLLSDDEAKDRVLLEMESINRSPSRDTDGIRGNHISSSDRINGQNTENKTSHRGKSDSPSSQHISNAMKHNIPNDGVLENDDLIAVLKGIDEDDSRGEGVTIEGEGEYQIMEIEDDADIADDIESTLASHNAKGNKSENKLKSLETLEEERQVALEQIEMLNARPYNKSRRRKQDIKPILQPADLVTSLVSEWSDDDAAVEEAVVNINAKGMSSPKTSPQSKSAQQTQKSGNSSKDSNIHPVKEKAPVKKSEAKGKPKPASKLPSETAAQKKSSPAVQQPNIPPPTIFKRTRVIKRKIIWDPDAPETSFSYANLVKSSSASKKEPAAKKGRLTPQPNKKKESSVEKTTPSSGSAKPSAQKASTSKQTEAQTASKAQQKRRQSEVLVAIGNKKKKFSEIDRLLGDEGAFNMLSSLEKEARNQKTDTGDCTKSTVRVRMQTPTPDKILRKDRPLVKVKRTPKPKQSDSWDYVYKKQKDDAMIARRRSTSSFSSSASHHRLSLDAPIQKLKAAANITEIPLKSAGKVASQIMPEPQVSLVKLSTTAINSKQFEFAKPENKSQKIKKNKSSQDSDPLSEDIKKTAVRRSVQSPETTDEQNKTSPTETTQLSPTPGSASADVVINKIGKVAQIVLNTHRAKIANTFTAQLLNNLSSTLDRLSEDKQCYVALIVSNSPNFCQGIDFTDLAIGTPDKRKAAAIQMAKAVKNFLQTLATFPKPLIVGVNGFNSGLGVTMLPLFDFVIGSDKGSYETPYARIGQIPEGYCIWSETPKIRSTFKTRLLWLCEKLHSTESSLSGLVTKLSSPNKVNEEAFNCAKKIASFSPETYRSMKKTNIECNLENILTGLEEEHDLVLDQWLSSECLDNFKQFLQKGQWKGLS